MKTLRFLPLPLLLVIGLLAAGCGSSSTSVPQNAIAIVGTDTITKQQYNDLLAQAKSQYQANKKPFPAIGSVAYKTLSDQAVGYLVQQSELQQRANALGVKVTQADVDKQIAQIKKQYFGGSQAKYKAQLKAQGMTEPQLRQALYAQVLDRKIYAKVTSNVKVSDADVKTYYDQNKSQYTTPESREVRHILVDSKQKAQRIRTQLVKGADFATLAKKYSKDTSSAKQGGKLCVAHGTGAGGATGCFQTVPPFDKAAFSLKTNEISEPVHSAYGWHIIQPVGPITPPKVTPLASVQATIRANLLSTKKTSTMQAWVDAMTKSFASKISYQNGYQPASTSTTATGTTG